MVTEHRIEKVIDRLSHKLDQNSRWSMQSDLEFVFNGGYWKQRRVETLHKTFNSFTEFAIHSTPLGLGWTKKILEAMLLPELKQIWQAIEDEIPQANKHGGDMSKVLSHLENKGTGNRSYSIAVLKRDAPEIAERVIKKEISAAEGMRQAGKREKTVTVKVNVEGFINAIKKVLSEDEIHELFLRLFQTK